MPPYGIMKLELTSSNVLSVIVVAWVTEPIIVATIHMFRVYSVHIVLMFVHSCKLCVESMDETLLLPLLQSLPPSPPRLRLLMTSAQYSLWRT